MKHLVFLLCLTLIGCATTPSAPIHTDVMRVIEKTAELAPGRLHDEFVLSIKASGTKAGTVFLNTELDYRDRRNVTLVLPPHIVQELENQYGSSPLDFLVDKQLRVTGVAKQVQMWIVVNGKRTSKYYFQTHIDVAASGDIEVMGERVDAKAQAKTNALQKDYQIYMAHKGHKAYALAYDDEKTWTSGYGFGYKTQQSADQRALDECSNRRVKREIQAECSIIARGGSDARPRSVTKRYSGCEDPAYHKHILERLAFYNKLDRDGYTEALEQLDGQTVEDLAGMEKVQFLLSNTVPAARFDKVETAQKYIELLNSPSLLSRFAAGDIQHRTNIAKGWLALNQGDEKGAIAHMLESTETTGSVVLGSFGPDKSLIRELYKRGHKKSVLEYLTRSEAFWKNDSAKAQIKSWRTMAAQDCPIQFQFYDTLNVEKLGLTVN